MHVALVKRRCSLKYGGGERYSVNLARGLVNLGHRVTIIGEEIDEPLLEHVNFVPVRVNHFASWTKNRSFARNAAAASRETACDVVYALCPTTEADAIRVTSRIHPEWMAIRYPHSWQHWVQAYNPRHSAIISLERECYALAPRIKTVVAQSSLDARLLVQHYNIKPGKIRIIHNGVDGELFHPREKAFADSVRESLEIPEGAHLMVLAGGVALRGKGLESLLQAMSFCSNRRLFLAVLSGGASLPWQQMARRLGLSSRVRFIARRDDFSRFLAAADLFVLPTVYEPFPNVVLEAMACGVPVLTTRKSGLADVVAHGESGYLVHNADCVLEMAAQIDCHFDQSASRQRRMGQTARQIAARMHLGWHARQVAAMLAAIRATPQRAAA